MKYYEEFEKFVEENKNTLFEQWDVYKYDRLYDNFHYDNVDYFNEDQFIEMCEDIHYQMQNEL